MPGVVFAIRTEVGAKVKKGDPLVVLSAVRICYSIYLSVRRSSICTYALTSVAYVLCYSPSVDENGDSRCRPG
jgi:hypothetical protein